ncbi:ABC transporter permease [Peribacillus psychrosaccharolyticus]|uniref:ABC transporter permease n=1 Tax=Peribacillus psychrosaccharolyticus TaxID=1407 RepID=UPI003D2DC523
MKKIWSICSMEVRLVFRNPRNYLIMFAMPIIFTLLFGNVMTESEEEKATILYVDQDKTTLSKGFIDVMRKDDSLFTLVETSSKEASQKLKEKEAEGVILISKGFGEQLKTGSKPEVRFERIPEFVSSRTVTDYVSNKLSTIVNHVSASKTWSEYSGQDWPVMFENLQRDEQVQNTLVKRVDMNSNAINEKNISAKGSGFCIMFLMIKLFTVTGVIIEAKGNGVWYRLLSTPVTRFQVASGYLLSFFLIGWIQFSILMLATNLLFDVSWGSPLPIFILVSAMMLAFVGIGLVIATTAKTLEQQSGIASLIVIPTCMLSGVYWPLELEPTFMQKIAELLPQTWAMRGFTDIITTGTLESIMTSTIILLLFAAIFLTTGIKKIRL